MSLEKIDEWILDNIFQKLADYWTETTGTSCFKLATVFLGLFFLVQAVILAYCHIENKYGTQAFEFILTLVIGYIWLKKIEHLLDMERDNEGLRVSNPERLFGTYGRILFVLCCLVTLPAFVYSIINLDLWEYDSLLALRAHACAAVLYAMACTPKPPRPLRAGNRIAVNAT